VSAETSRISFLLACHRADHRLYIVADATTTPCLDNPMVTGDPHIRFYAGAPLITPTGQLGTLV
jgi:GAF domain-containing protein